MYILKTKQAMAVFTASDTEKFTGKKKKVSSQAPSSFFSFPFSTLGPRSWEKHTRP